MQPLTILSNPSESLFKITSAGFKNYIDSEFNKIIVKSTITQLQAGK